ncbi:MAG: carboxylating nicotinate-nucleotide diphosphorylase [Chloroflexi bacterium]|nr:carboxylating nicotinate-nucleotide diphosphorylase [Chloroflexota bacterium]
MITTDPRVRRLVAEALEEDSSWQDITTLALVPPEVQGTGEIVAKAPGVLAGIEVAELAFALRDPLLEFRRGLSDGTPLEPGMRVATVRGQVTSILAAERTALNFLQRLCGIATATSRYVQAVAGTKARIVDTRKTTPGLRLLEKYAVRVGGGHNHRTHLGDGVLVKDNHLAALSAAGVDMVEGLRRLRRRLPHTLRLEVEVSSLEQLQAALEAGVDAVLLDNMPLEMMRRAVGRVAGKAIVEASGGIRLDNVRAVAETGVDLISIGALTHSAPALDLSLELLAQG